MNETNYYLIFFSSEETPVLVKVYASCLRNALLRYELKLLDVSKESKHFFLNCIRYVL